MPRPLSTSEVEKIASLARLNLTEAEKAAAAQELTRILEYVERLSEVPTDNVLPFASAAGDIGSLRPDQAEVFPERKSLTSHKTFRGGFLTTKSVFSGKRHDS